MILQNHSTKPFQKLLKFRTLFCVNISQLALAASTSKMSLHSLKIYHNFKPWAESNTRVINGKKLSKVISKFEKDIAMLNL